MSLTYEQWENSVNKWKEIIKYIENDNGFYKWSITNRMFYPLSSTVGPLEQIHYACGFCRAYSKDRSCTTCPLGLIGVCGDAIDGTIVRQLRRSLDAGNWGRYTSLSLATTILNAITLFEPKKPVKTEQHDEPELHDITAEGKTEKTFEYELGEAVYILDKNDYEAIVTPERGVVIGRVSIETKNDTSHEYYIQPDMDWGQGERRRATQDIYKTIFSAKLASERLLHETIAENMALIDQAVAKLGGTNE